jgi:DNA-binding NarL/FixJ family response regulator
MRKIKIVCADDHALFLNGVSNALKPFEEIELVFNAKNGVELLTALKNLTDIDIILLDIQMPMMDGLTALSILNSLYPKIKVIMLTMHNDASMILRCIELGAAGYLTKNSSISDIVLAIANVIEGNTFFPCLLRKDYLI